MGTDEADNQILNEALRRIRRKLVDEVEALSGEETSDHAIAAAILSAVVNVDGIAAIAKHSRELVGLTRVLLGATIVLAALTAVLLWRVAV